MGLDSGTWWDLVVGLGGTWWWDLVVGLGCGTWLWDLVGLYYNFLQLNENCSSRALRYQRPRLMRAFGSPWQRRH